jgi:hypothetical protein
MQPVTRFVAPGYRLVVDIYQIHLPVPQPLRRFGYPLVVPVEVSAQPPQPFSSSLKPGEYRFLAYRTNTADL